MGFGMVLMNNAEINRSSIWASADIMIGANRHGDFFVSSSVAMLRHRSLLLFVEHHYELLTSEGSHSGTAHDELARTG